MEKIQPNPADRQESLKKVEETTSENTRKLSYMGGYLTVDIFQMLLPHDHYHIHMKKTFLQMEKEALAYMYKLGYNAGAAEQRRTQEPLTLQKVTLDV